MDYNHGGKSLDWHTGHDVLVLVHGMSMRRNVKALARSGYHYGSMVLVRNGMVQAHSDHRSGILANLYDMMAQAHSDCYDGKDLVLGTQLQERGTQLPRSGMGHGDGHHSFSQESELSKVSLQ